MGDEPHRIAAYAGQAQPLRDGPAERYEPQGIELGDVAEEDRGQRPHRRLRARVFRDCLDEARGFEKVVVRDLPEEHHELMVADGTVERGLAPAEADGIRSVQFEPALVIDEGERGLIECTLEAGIDLTADVGDLLADGERRGDHRLGAALEARIVRVGEAVADAVEAVLLGARGLGGELAPHPEAELAGALRIAGLV